MSMLRVTICFVLFLIFAFQANAQVGDPQLGTDHPWYPGELQLSSFDRLFATQAAQYKRATGIEPTSDHDRAMASWFFRNTHYAHGEEGKENLWGTGFSNEYGNTTRDYWTGLFAHGFGLCGTTHAQWTAELDQLLGHCRSRVTGTSGHNSFEAFLTGGPYEDGRWAMLDHDLSTVIYDDQGRRLLGLDEISKQWKKLANRDYRPERQNAWLVSGLHPNDGASYASYSTAEYMAGYAGPPPIVYLRRGESLKRFFQPGLEDGKTFVYWGRNYNTANIPGPERSRTWVNQPHAMFGSTYGTPHVDGQLRFGNAVYQWRPNFEDGSYRDGVLNESGSHVTLEFHTPYIIGATPANNEAWGIYERGGTNGMIITGNGPIEVEISTDGGHHWNNAGKLNERLDLTDFVKGHRQYHLRLNQSAEQLAKANLLIRTVCQLNPSILPRLKENGTQVKFDSGGMGIVRFGPNKQQCAPKVVEGSFDSPKLTIRLETPRAEPIRQVFVAAHVASSNPPSPEVEYRMEYSWNEGKSWEAMLVNSRLIRRKEEPSDFWSQSMWSASLQVPHGEHSAIQVRFRNNGGKNFLRVEGNLIYAAPRAPAKISYSWKDHRGQHHESQKLHPEELWTVKTGDQVETRWVEIATP